MGITILDVAMRYLHVVSAIALVGGMMFVPLCVRPAIRVLDQGFGQSVLQLIERRLRWWVWGGALGLFVSGVYNWIALAGLYRDIGPIANALIGTKVLLAAIVLVLLWLRQSNMLGARADRPLLIVAVHLAAIVILLASILRHLRLEHLAEAAGG